MWRIWAGAVFAAVLFVPSVCAAASELPFAYETKGRIYVQARALFESMGLQVEWIPDKRVVRVQRPDGTVLRELTRTSKMATSGGRRYVPLRPYVDSVAHVGVTAGLVAEYQGKRWITLERHSGIVVRPIAEGAGRKTWSQLGPPWASAALMFRSLGLKTVPRSGQARRVVAALGADGREAIRITEGNNKMRVRGRVVTLDRPPEIHADGLQTSGQRELLCICPFAFAKAIGGTVRWEAWIDKQFADAVGEPWFMQVRTGPAVPIAIRPSGGWPHDLQFDFGAIRNENYGAPGEELRTADGAVLPTPRLPSQYHVGCWLHLRVRNSANRPCKITGLSFEGRPIDEVLTTESQKGPVLWYRLGQNELPPGSSTWLNIRLRNEPRKDVLIGLDTAQAGAVTARVMAPAADR